MVEGEEFERIRAEICASGPASDGENLLGMAIDCCAHLGDPAYADDVTHLWQDVKIRRSDGAEWLISGRATGKRGDAVPIAAELSTIWNRRLRYRYRSAHTLSTTAESVTLRGVTQLGPGDIWVTVRIEVALS